MPGYKPVFGPCGVTCFTLHICRTRSAASLAVVGPTCTREHSPAVNAGDGRYPGVGSGSWRGMDGARVNSWLSNAAARHGDGLCPVSVPVVLSTQTSPAVPQPPRVSLFCSLILPCPLSPTAASRVVPGYTAARRHGNLCAVLQLALKCHGELLGGAGDDGATPSERQWAERFLGLPCAAQLL